MDKLNLWNDDPEEVLFDLGFGCDEPDLSSRIPTRFINYQSRARGINLQVFLDAQKSRLDLENPDVSNRFRQLEVLQQVTFAFSCLVEASSPLKALPAKDMSPETLERRRRVGILFRRASKKSLGQIYNHKSTSESQQPIPSLTDKVSSDFVQRKWSPGQDKESSEMEEIHGFGEDSVKGSYTGSTGNLVQNLIRTNSCPVDSSSFPEEPFIPSIIQPVSPGSDLIKALSDLSEGNTDSQRSEGPGSSPFPPYISPFPLISLCQTSSAGDKYLPSSPCPPLVPLKAFGASHSPALVGLPKFDLQIPNTETVPDQEQSSPSSTSALPCEYLPASCSSPKLQSITLSKSPSYPSPVSFTSVSPTSSPIKTVDTTAPFTYPSSPFHDPEGTTCFTFSSVPPPDSYFSPSPDVNCQFYESTSTFSAQSDSSGCPWNIHPKWTDVSLHENLISASVYLSFLFPSSPDLPPSAIPDFRFPTSLASSTLKESISHSLENNQNDAVFLNSDGRDLSDSPTDAPKEDDEKPSSLSFQRELDMDSLTAPSPLGPSSCKLEEGGQRRAVLPPNQPIPCCHPVFSSQSHLSDGLIDLATGRILDPTERSNAQQHRTVQNQDKHDDNTHSPSVSPIQDVIRVNMDHTSLDSGLWTHSDDAPQRIGRKAGDSERLTCTVQNQEAVVDNSDIGSSAGLSEGSLPVNPKICSQMEIDLRVPSHSLHDELLAKTEQEEFGKVCQMTNNGIEHESSKRYIVLHDQVPEACSRPEVKPNDLIESLDQVFETSVDSPDCENVDMDAFFQQLDTEGQVFWAEPIQVSNPSPVDEESGSLEISDKYHSNPLLPIGPAALNTFSSPSKSVSLSLSSSTIIDTEQTSRMKTDSSLILASVPSLSVTQNLQPSNRSVSVQMLSSHIAHRKDVPLITESKHIFSGSLPLDTSTPFRAVQSWTDLHIQQNALTKQLSHVAPHTVPNKVNISRSAPETTYRHPVISVPPSFPLLPDDCRSKDSVPNMARNCEPVSASVDTGLWPGEPHEVDKKGKEDEEKLLEGHRTATMTCCCSCDHHCTVCTQKSYNKQQAVENIPYSLDELEEMMLSLQHFRSVLSNMELQLSEDQAAVYSALSDKDREKVQDIQKLRHAVKQQAGELELQLHELAHQYDDSLKLKMHRLLDEQSLLCSQLRVFLPGRVPSSFSPVPNRTVATQCCLPPWLPMQRSHASAWTARNMDFTTQLPPGSENICEGQGGSPTKADKINIVGFLQRVRKPCIH
ncbi:uncharacterized protein itprid1 [Amphiprion ocellaris]|uniref:uncharacterized protein itprid1 n=1 Tax=Amphiprion ocellaris TaxID=80972 RepID=UPI0024112D40|nr:uncharacterized protein itprid1 [Amphiprion ocellaris]